MPQVTIRTGFFAADGNEEELSEFLCDVPGCPNVATEVVGCLRECGLSAVMCHEHASAQGVSNAANDRTRESSGE